MLSDNILTNTHPPYEGGRGRSVIGLGETVYDIIFKNNQPQKAVPGGSAFNAIISLGRTIGASVEKKAEVKFITEVGE